jgi:cardiolipin synthase
MTPWIFAHFLEIAGFLLAIILIPRILLEKRHPGATIAWVLAIGLVPYVGVPLYFLIGGKRIKKVSRKKDWNLVEKGIPDQHPVFTGLTQESRKIAHILVQSGILPPSRDNKIKIIDDGVDAYESLFDLLEGATESIEIATFILGKDEVGKALVSLLERKARDGMEIRLLLDALGCLRTRGKFVDPLRKAGGHVGIFLPLFSLRRRSSANLRNHRKMAIVDGERAFVGGMNLATEYMGPHPYRNRWKDVSMLLEGGAVGHIRNFFWKDWIFATHEPVDAFNYCPVSLTRRDNGHTIQVVGDGPDVADRPLYTGILAALNRVKRDIWVVTPYFVPDDALSASLILAARLGCHVRIIMPEKSNHPLVDLAGRSYLYDLMRSGVQFYFYQPGMLHAKLFVIDRQIAVVGSANMDIRSFQLNFEIANFLYDEKSIEEVLEVIRRITLESREITLEELKRNGKFRTFSEDICRVFSPLL